MFIMNHKWVQDEQYLPIENTYREGGRQENVKPGKCRLEKQKEELWYRAFEP
jgi:hypothetical protein